MKEHRLIERMIRLLGKELTNSKKTFEINTEFIDAVIDFFKSYADKIHHGKEEDILFQVLKKKNISNKHKKMLDKLLNDHKTSREIIHSLDQANIQYANGYHANINKIHESLSKLIKLYPKHIKVEDTQFFFPAMAYFAPDEFAAMLEEFYQFDRAVIHGHYSDLIDTLEKQIK